MNRENLLSIHLFFLEKVYKLGEIYERSRDIEKTIAIAKREKRWMWVDASFIILASSFFHIVKENNLSLTCIKNIQLEEFVSHYPSLSSESNILGKSFLSYLNALN